MYIFIQLVMVYVGFEIPDSLIPNFSCCKKDPISYKIIPVMVFICLGVISKVSFLL